MELPGMAASCGVVSGFAFIAKDLYETTADDMRNGDVLVIKFAMPLYFDFFMKASAIVTEVGGVTCHAANIAREMGIPCVVSVENILSHVKTGDSIVVDGNKGVVYVGDS